MSLIIRKYLFKGIILSLVFGLVGVQDVYASVKERQLKAAILYNIAKFVKWPEHTFKNEDSPVILSILGNVNFERELDLLQGRTLGKRPLLIKHVPSVENCSEGHILFVASSEQELLDEIFSSVQRQPILTISDLDDFATQGGMINLVKVGKNIRFVINLDAVNSADLKLSSKLHDLATQIIRTAPDKEQQ